MKKLFAFLTLIPLLLLAQTAEAKVLPQASKPSVKITSKVSTSAGINISPKLRADRKALIIYFSNLQNASSVSYSLIYDTSTQQEGAIGSLDVSGSSNQSTELLFGTCSKNVCRYHSGIANMRLEVSYTLKSGKKYLKKYKIKV